MSRAVITLSCRSELQIRNDRLRRRSDVGDQCNSRRQQSEHVRGAWRGKGNDGVGSGNRPRLWAHVVGIGAGRNVDRDHGNLARVHDRDRIRIEAAYWRFEPRTQNCIQIQICGQEKAFQFIAGLHHDCRVRQFVKHEFGVAPQIAGARQQDDLHIPAFPLQFASGDEAIAAIVALAADNHNAMSRCVTRHNVIRDSGTGVLHQRRRRDAEALAAGAVNGAHFFCGNDLHDWEGGAAVKPAAP